MGIQKTDLVPLVDKAFLKQYQRVQLMKAKMAIEISKLQELCIHYNLDKTSAFPEGMYGNCRLCGKDKRD